MVAFLMVGRSKRYSCQWLFFSPNSQTLRVPHSRSKRAVRAKLELPKQSGLSSPGTVLLLAPTRPNSRGETRRCVLLCALGKLLLLPP